MRRSMIAASAVALVLATAGPSAAAPGDLDTTFDGNGMLTVGFGSAAEGLVVLGGTILMGGTYDGDLGFVSLNGSGSPTPGFGTDGVVALNLGGAERGSGLAVDTDGSLVVAGWTNANGQIDTAVGKVDADGTPTAAFDGGAHAFDLGNGKEDRAYDVDLTSNGKIVVGGFVKVSGERRFLLARFRTNGTRDTSFGGGDGVVKLRIGSRAEIRDVLVLPNDAILVAGVARVGGHATDYAIARFRTNGTLDPGFSGDGKLLVGDTTPETAEAVELMLDGRFAVAGSRGRDIYVRWFTGSGIISESMGVNGYARISYGSEARAYDLLPGTNGRLYVVGSGIGSENNVLVARLDQQGALDDAWAGDGTAAIDFFSAETGAAAAFSSGGRLLVAGQTDGFDAPDPGRAVSGSMLLVRLLA